MLITNGNITDRTGPEAGNAVAALQDCLPWARQIGTPDNRNIQSDSVIDRVRQHLATAADSSVHARDRFHTEMARSRDRHLSRDDGFSRDDGLEL